MNEETTQLNGSEERHIKSDGTEKWQDAYNSDPELAHSPVLANFKTQEDALKGLVELKAYQGRSVKLLGEDATPEEKAAWVEKIRTHIPNVTIMPNADDTEDYARFEHERGVPKDGTYTVPADVKFESLEQPGIDEAAVMSKSLGHTQKQHTDFLKGIDELQKNANDALATHLAEEDAKLTQAWGDAREQNEGIVSGLVSKFEDAGVPVGDLNNAGKIMLLNIAKSMSSEPQTFSQQQTPTTQKTPAEIRARQAELFTILTKHGGRDLGGRKASIQAEYQQTFDDLAKYK